METQVACFTCGNRQVTQRWRYYKQLRRAGYSESEALDEAQVTRECCRSTIATQTDVNLKILAAGRPVTDESGVRTVENIGRFPKIETFGVLSDVKPKPVVEPSELSTIAYQSYEGDLLDAEEASLELMGVDVFAIREEAREQRRVRFQFPEPGSLRGTMSSAVQDLPMHRSMQRATLGDGNVMGRTYSVGRGTGQALAARLISSKNITMRSAAWKNIQWNVGVDYDITSHDKAFRTPFFGGIKALDILVQIVGNFSANFELRKEGDIQPVDVLDGVNEFVNQGLPEETVIGLLADQAFIQQHPESVIALRASQHMKNVNASVKDIRMMSGFRMIFEAFQKQPQADNTWLLKFDDTKRPIFEALAENNVAGYEAGSIESSGEITTITFTQPGAEIKMVLTDPTLVQNSISKTIAESELRGKKVLIAATYHSNGLKDIFDLAYDTDPVVLVFDDASLLLSR